MKNATKKSILLILFISFFGFTHAETVIKPNSFESGKTYIKIWIDGMACPFCAYGLEKSIKKLPGVKNLFVDLNKGFIVLTVLSENSPSEQILKKLIKEAGFVARKFEYSDKPFVSKKE